MRAACLMLTIALVTPARARPPDDPTIWLRQIYDLYHKAEKQTELLKDSDEVIAFKHASRGFAALLKRDLDCEDKSHEICALDWDFIVNGQAWELSRVNVGALAVAGAHASVTVTFTNLKSSNRNVYDFVREDGAWKLDDVESGQSGRATIRIAKMLRDSKEY